ncbi:MAG: TrkH family potassium uptake protein, partial [Alistipes sp.]|nr:TrkH family potassium uptake protein [Alistipes sp.]
RSEVVRIYLAIIAATTVTIAISLFTNDNYSSFGEALRHSLFQVTSLISTTGFATANTNIWTPLAILLLIFVSIICACAGSTSGGMKVDRLLLFTKLLRAKIRQQQHPNAIIRIRIDGVTQEREQSHTVVLFIVTYLFIILLASVVNMLFGQDLLTGISSAISCIGNVGPAFGELGSADSFADVPAILKLQDSLLMLMGRLEIFGFIQLLFIKWWR